MLNIPIWLLIAAAVLVLAVVVVVVLRRRPPKGSIKIQAAKNDYAAIARILLEGCGGKENVLQADLSDTFLRLKVKDAALVDENKIKSSGAVGVFRPGKTAVLAVTKPGASEVRVSVPGAEVKRRYDGLWEIVFRVSGPCIVTLSIC